MKQLTGLEYHQMQQCFTDILKLMHTGLIIWNRLRNLQDKTGGFNAFIPLKYKKANNSMSYLGEVSIIEDLRNYAVSRIFLDNIPHIKAYWPMIGKETAQLSLSFGADDLDGTIDDTTRIYSMAGAEEKNPAMTTDEICKLIRRSRIRTC